MRLQLIAVLFFISSFVMFGGLPSRSFWIPSRAIEKLHPIGHLRIPQPLNVPRVLPRMNVKALNAQGDTQNPEDQYPIKSFADLQSFLNMKFAAIEKDMTTLKDNVSTLKDDVNTLKNDTNKKLDKIYRFQGLLWEQQARTAAGTMFGAPFARQYTANSIIDIVNLILPEAPDKLNELTPSSQEVAKHLLEGRFCEQLVCALGEDYGREGHPWCSEEGEVNLQNVRFKLNEIQDKAMQTNVQKLLNLLKIETSEARIAHLLTCDSCGVMLLTYAALRDKKSLNRVLEFDMRGSVQYIENQVFIRVGEAKSSRDDYRKAQEQLRMRLYILRLVVGIVVPKATKCLLMGHVFLPNTEGPVPDAIRGDISFYCHGV